MGAILSDAMIMSVVGMRPPIERESWERAAVDAINGDTVAEQVFVDILLETVGVEGVNPFHVGQEVFLVTQTLYYVGRVKECGIGWVLLEDASWVHWTGRLSVLMKRKKFSGWTESRKPRVEPIATPVRVWFPLIADYDWTGGELPKEPIP